MNRRRFLQQAARAAPVAAIALRGGAAAAPDNPIVIVGAGLAGLRAAEVLRAAGRDVVVLEAQDRAGGRVHTVRTFDDGLHAEAGAIRFAGAHRAVVDAVRRHRLSLTPFEPQGATVIAIDRKPSTTLDPSALLEHYVGTLPSNLEQFDRVTWPQWLASRGARPDEVTLMTVGGDSSQVSAYYVLRQYALLRASTQRYKIAGGMDRLPAAMAASLRDIVRYNSPVVRVDRMSAGFRVDYHDGHTARSLTAPRVVFAVPAGTLRQIEVRPGLSSEKRRALERLAYYPGVRFLLQTKRRFWQTAGLSGSARTDRATETWDATFDQPAARGVLGASTAGEPGPDVMRGVDLVADAFPAIRSEFEKGTVHRWSADPWARGAFALYGPGQMTGLLPRLAAADDGLHFAGEHTSLWTGWMEGALESGERAAREVLASSK